MPTARAQSLFVAAVEIADPAARSRYLIEACGGDTELKARVESLLRAHNQPDSLLDAPLVSPRNVDHAETRSFSPDPDHAETSTGGGSAHDDEIPLGFLAPANRPDSLGRIGHYEVLQVLGQGGFGIVFRAFDDILQRVVAVKVLAPQLAATSPARKRFLREARTSAAVRHENVVQVYEVGEAPLPYIAMEFIPGETLQQLLDRTGPIEPVEVVRIGRQIAEGLAAAHVGDLIHRDIKPGNILLDGGAGRVKITDFGLARAADDASISQSGIIAGTPMYMAPEQAKGEKLDQRADLFSLGSVLYQMAAGRPPFRANSTVAVLKRVAEDVPRDIREIIPETPQWLCNIIAKLHAKDPDERFQSAREVADVLADCEGQLKANAKLKDFSRIPRGKQPVAATSGRWKWAAAAVLLLPVLALAVAEGTGVSHLFRGRAAADPADPIGDPAPVVASKQNPLPPTFTNSIGMKLRFIPPGKFTMGSSQEEIDFWLKQAGDGWENGLLPGESPQHEVEITQPFYMGQTAVTVGQFRQFVKATGHQTHAEREGNARIHLLKAAPIIDADTNWRNPGFAQTDDHPVVCVNWNDAVAFCNWLSKQEGTTYRLPTEAEWEYGCRAGTKGRWSFGDSEGELVNYARIGSNSQRHPWPVAGLKANAWGLHDMHGNVVQWCQDVYDANYYQISPPKDPPGPGAGDQRVTRGSSYLHPPLWCRSAFRSWNQADNCWDNVGFRVVLVVSPAARVQIESGAKDKPSSTAIAPFTDADVKRIAALPADEQIEEVRKELMRRNPGFDGKMETRIEDGVVTEFKIVTDQVTGIAPIRVFNSLRVLVCNGTWSGKPNGLLADLTPLKGMNLAGLTWLDLSDTKVTDADLVCFKECKKLTTLNLVRTQISDTGLVNFQDCKALTILRLDATKVSDAGLAHFKGCQALRELWLGHTKVADSGLAHFKDCKNLQLLSLEATQVSDAGLAHFKDCKDLLVLALDRTQVSDVGLAHFKDLKKLSELLLRESQVTDAGLAYFKGMPLKWVSIDHTTITDLTPLQGMPLEGIRLTPKNITKGLDLLRGMKNLKTIGIDWSQTWPAAEFWERYDKGEFGKAFTDADVKRIAALPAEQQVEEVRKELVRRNTGFDGKMETKIEGGVVTEFRINTDKVADLAPIRVFNGLRVLACTGTFSNDQTNGQLADLTPLQGMNLTSLMHLDLNRTQVSDAAIVYFKDCKNLSHLDLGSTHVSDKGLTHFKECKSLKVLFLYWIQVSDAGLVNFKDCKDLTRISLSGTKVSDAGLAFFKDCKNLMHLDINDTQMGDASLANVGFKGMRLAGLGIYNTAITDLTILQGSVLEDIRLTPKSITKGLDTLRGMKSLKTIGITHGQSWPAAEFWERYDKGEFK